MRIFVTGATGFVGSAVVRELMDAGHRVSGLARSAAAATLLMAAGAEVHPGSLQDLDSLRAGAAAADGVIHTGFIHDFSRFKASCEIDRQAIEALGQELRSSGRPLIVTSALGVLPQGRLVTEDDHPVSGVAANPRAASEEAARAVAECGGNVSVVRLAPSVHGSGDHGFVPMLISRARESGTSAYVGEGLNRWPAIHRLDAAVLYRLAIERGVPGASYHAVAEHGVQLIEIARLIAHHLEVPAVSKSPVQAAEHFGWFNHFASMDILASSQRTSELLGWAPRQVELLQDLEGYFGKAP